MPEALLRAPTRKRRSKHRYDEFDDGRPYRLTRTTDFPQTSTPAMYQAVRQEAQRRNVAVKIVAEYERGEPREFASLVVQFMWDLPFGPQPREFRDVLPADEEPLVPWGPHCRVDPLTPPTGEIERDIERYLSRAQARR